MGSVLGASSALVAGVGGGSALVVQAAGFLHLFVGVLLVAAVLVYVGGMIVWAVFLGSYPSPRDKAIGILMWVPPILFTVIVVLAVAQFMQNHPDAVLYILSLVVFAVIAWVVVQAVRGSASGEEE